MLSYTYLNLKKSDKNKMIRGNSLDRIADYFWEDQFSDWLLIAT